MAELAFVAMGDLHLSHHIWCSQRHIVDDALVAFQSLVGVALQHRVPLMLVGDIFDTVKPTSDILKFFRQQMDRCEAAGIAVYALQGNHDKQATPWYTAVHDHVIHIGDGQLVEIGIVRCVGLDYALKDRLAEQLAELSSRDEKPECLFLHQACKQALGFEHAWNCDIEWVPEGIPLTIIGDIHREWDWVIREGQTAHYTGVSHARDISQIGPKTVMLVYDDLTIKRVPIDYRDIKKFWLTAPDQAESLKVWLADVTLRVSPLPAFAWVVHTPDCAPIVRHICNEYHDRAVFTYEEVASPEAVEIDLGTESEGDAGLPSVEKLLMKLVDPDTEPQAFAFIIELLDTQNSVLDVIRNYRETFLKGGPL